MYRPFSLQSPKIVSYYISYNLKRIIIVYKQDKSFDIEQQPPYGNRTYSNILPQKRGGDYKTELSKFILTSLLPLRC